MVALTPLEILRQVHQITSNLIELGLSDTQNFPVQNDVGAGEKEISTTNGLGVALKNIPYGDIYKELERTQSYNIKMLDGALIQIQYRFKNDDIISHRLAFFPSPTLEQFQNKPEIYNEDEIYADIIMKNIVPFPVRFDFNKDTVHGHPNSHLTLGQYKNCRIPVSAPLTPNNFIRFILQSFYNTAFQKFSEKIIHNPEMYNQTITIEELKRIHLKLPD